MIGEGYAGKGAGKLSDFGSDYGVEAFGRTKASDRERKAAAQQRKLGIDVANLGFKRSRGYWQPQYEYGQDTLNAFRDWGKDGDITSDPSYQWRFNQGLEGAQNSAIASGMGGLSGNALRGITDYGQQAASQEFGNEFQRWMQKLGLGQDATNAMSGIAERQGTTIGGMIAGGGQQDFQNFQNIQNQGRQDLTAQNQILSDWFSNIFGGSGGMGGMGGGGG